ncbi:hypothetical protein [Burkholderia glumae]|uniref:hypothetical protein n=1 Tax=Burkholderia glumae TaxID=337 RepID=UPI000F5EF408|nr:hypothetical protein [Burkholderia glumae]QJW77883.1 hypothetical protein GAS18_03355 [Burkholderia glumae]RQZ76596.1 hypothetical protein DF052_01210 [Burkholderia glumae]
MRQAIATDAIGPPPAVRRRMPPSWAVFFRRAQRRQPASAARRPGWPDWPDWPDWPIEIETRPRWLDRLPGAARRRIFSHETWRRVEALAAFPLRERADDGAAGGSPWKPGRSPRRRRGGA